MRRNLPPCRSIRGGVQHSGAVIFLPSLEGVLCSGRLEVVVLFGMLSLVAQFVYWSRIVSGLNQEHAHARLF